MSQSTSIGAEADLETRTASITKTVRLKLETSQAKNEVVRRAIDDWQRVARYAAVMMPSIEEDRWGTRHTQQLRLARWHFDDLDIYAHDRDAAVRKVSEAFASWRENGKPGANPAGEYGDGNYLRMCSCSSCPGEAITAHDGRYTIQPNDRGIGLRVKPIRGTNVWFHINGGRYQHRYLQDIISGTAKFGNVELRLEADGTLFAHVPSTVEVPVIVAEDVPTWVGVDLRDKTLYTTVTMDDSGEIRDVEIESGGEFRHHRERISKHVSRLSEQGDLRAIRGSRHRLRYTDHITHEVSRRIVNRAVEQYPAGIVLENLTGMRQDVDDPIHDWPYGDITAKIAYKANEAGIPVAMIEPYNTTAACRKCGGIDTTWVDHSAQTFHCEACGYEVHVGVNAAANVAMTQVES